MVVFIIVLNFYEKDLFSKEEDIGKEKQRRGPQMVKEMIEKKLNTKDKFPLHKQVQLLCTNQLFIWKVKP